jgi:hypothetical protein
MKIGPSTRSFGWQRSLLSFLYSNIVLLAFPVNVAAQSTSVIEGRVTDQQGLAVEGAAVAVRDMATAIDRGTVTNASGDYRVVGLAAGIYTIAAFKKGFAPETLASLEVTVNRVIVLNVTLPVQGQVEKVEIVGVAPLLEVNTSASGATILPAQIEQMPINGRNYLDLLQLVPGIAINRQQDASLDGAVPILGERGGNTVFLIDGMPNRDEVSGGAAAQFNQDSILEFQVVTSSYNAEFGHGSGGVINVVSKNGTNDWHGAASLFHRNYELDSSDSAHVLNGRVPFLLRWDPSTQLGGPILKDKIFFFASAERILESRQLNFQFPAATPPVLVKFETPFNLHSETFDTRVRAKLDEQFGHHHLSQQMNLTNTHVTDFLPLLKALNLPSTRNNLDGRRLMLGFTDVAALGDQSNPFLVAIYGQHRRERSVARPSHPQAGTASTLDNLFSSINTGRLFGDQGQVQFGPGHSPLLLDQQYTSFGVNSTKQLGRHIVKFGWDFQHTGVDGTEANNLFNQLFATSADLGTFGPVDAGTYFLNQQGGLKTQDNAIRLRNFYNGAFVQDDWKILKNLTLNLGVRLDYDSKFPNSGNFSPRLGVAWLITSKTVFTASWGIFYDQFRLGLARDVPGFGGANLVTQTFLSFPRLFYGNPSTLSILFATLGLPVPCASSNLTDAQIAARGLTCAARSANGSNKPLYGIDHLNMVTAPGHAPVPANAAVNMQNVQSLTGLTPQQFADAASAAVGAAPGLFSYDPFGNLAVGGSAFPTNAVPISIDPGFKTPYNKGIHAGLQHELNSNAVMQLDYYHKKIDCILGIRDTNLAFAARIPGHGGQLVPGTGKQLIFGYGPWYQGTYDAITLGFRKRVSNRFSLEANYTWTHETDNALNSNLITDLQTGLGAGFASSNGPTDSFVGKTTFVTDPATGQTNAIAGFNASNGNPVPRAGIFYDGPDLDEGPSDLALNHTFLAHGVLQLPWKTSFTSIFRAQSGFHYSAAFATAPPDVDGDNHFNGVDFTKGRNHFMAPWLVNMDVRFAKRFDLGERTRLQIYLEFFNLFNRANPAAVNGVPPGSNSTAPQFGQVLQVLPGREGQAGIKVEF